MEAQQARTASPMEEQLGLTEDLQVGTTSSSPFTGSPTFDETPFHLHVGKNADVGSYVFIGRAEGNLLHYGRISDGTEENAEADPVRLQQKAAYGFGGSRAVRPGDRSPHLTRVMTAEVLGEVREVREDGRLDVGEPAKLPQTGMPVWPLPARLVPQLLDVPEDRDEGLHAGRIESGGETAPFILPMSTLLRHMLISGKTGIGKSYLAGVLMEEIVKKGIPIVSFDVLRDYIPATEHLGGVNLRVGRDMRVPFSVIGLSEFLSFVPNLTSSQSELVATAYEKVFGDAMNTLNQNGEVAVPLRALTDEIESVAEAFGQKGVGTRAVRRVRAAMGRSNLLTTEMGDWVDQIARRPVVNVFVGHLGQRKRNLTVGAAARMLQVMRVRGKLPPFVLFLDEAHFFLPAGGEGTASTGVIRELIRTARHHAIGVVVITQSPASLDKQVRLICNTKLTFALERDDMKAVAGTLSDLPEAVIDRIPKMPKGRAVVSSAGDIMRHASTVHIRTRRSPEGAPTPDMAAEVRRWREENGSLDN